MYQVFILRRTILITSFKNQLLSHLNYAFQYCTIRYGFFRAYIYSHVLVSDILHHHVWYTCPYLHKCLCFKVPAHISLPLL